MVIAIFGESCTGKSTLADALKDRLDAKIYSGKDYLRLSKSEADSEALFRQTLARAAENGETLIYIISEKEQLKLLPADCLRVFVTAGLETIKARFAKRTGGKLPPPISAMLERKHGTFDNEAHDIHIVSDEADAREACDSILRLVK